MNISIALAALLGAAMLTYNVYSSSKRPTTTATSISSNGDVTTTILSGANPFRTGAYVYVQENTLRSDMDWVGTVIGMDHGMVMVRDVASGVTAHVNKDQVFGAKR